MGESLLATPAARFSEAGLGIDPAASTNIFLQAEPWFGGDVRNSHQWSGAWIDGLVPYRDIELCRAPIRLTVAGRGAAMSFPGWLPI